MYSQYNEEHYITQYFGGFIGKFIEVGAFNAFTFSNVRKLYEQGWSGVLVEPAPKNYADICKVYENEPRITVINAALGKTTGEVEFWDSNGDAIGTTSLRHKEKWEKGYKVPYTKIIVPQMSVVEFCDTYCMDADFISIDTESTNYEIFQQIPGYIFDRVKLFCIEHDGLQLQYEKLMRAKGFKHFSVTVENILCGK